MGWIVSYDFDGVLSAGPQWVLDKFRDDLEDPEVEVWICTARYGHGPERAEVEAWLRFQGVEGVSVLYTDRELKGPYLLELIEANRHYDDDVDQVMSAEDHGIEAIYIDPDEEEW